jgi:hypothetical protein
MIKLFKIFILLLLVSTQLFARSKYATSAGTRIKTDIIIGALAFSTYLKITDDGNGQLFISSPAGAYKRLIGVYKSTLGRLLGKVPQRGILLSIKVSQVGDSIIGSARMPVLGKVEFRGRISKDSLTGDLIKNDTVVALLRGYRTTETKADYTSFYPIIKDITQKNIYSPQLLQTYAWEYFNKKLKKLTQTATDDIELFLGFSIYSQKLPCSHYFLECQNDQSAPNGEILTDEATVTFEEKSPDIAYIRIKNFSSSQKEIAEIFPKILNKKYESLIIDLRNNGGGGVEAALELAKNILPDSIFIGYFVTNKFHYDKFDKASFDMLPKIKANTTDGLIEELKTSPGAQLIAPKFSGSIFKGKIYVLTNGNTASTCEPIAYVLKNKGIATLVGEKTAGAMLSAANFTIIGKYKLILPIADFYTYDGQRIEKNGVQPDIVSCSDDALNKALETIQKQN